MPPKTSADAGETKSCRVVSRGRMFKCVDGIKVTRTASEGRIGVRRRGVVALCEDVQGHREPEARVTIPKLEDSKIQILEH